jgi:hypothetical protein
VYYCSKTRTNVAKTILPGTRTGEVVAAVLYYYRQTNFFGYTVARFMYYCNKPQNGSSNKNIGIEQTLGYHNKILKNTIPSTNTDHRWKQNRRMLVASSPLICMGIIAWWTDMRCRRGFQEGGRAGGERRKGVWRQGMRWVPNYAA